MTADALHVRRLREGLDQLREFRNKKTNANATEFKSWEQRMHQALVGLFGSHLYVARFGNLSFRVPRVAYRGRAPDPGYWGPQDQSRFEQDAEIAHQLITDALEEAETTAVPTDESPLENASQKVFVVHGHDELAKQTVARFLEKLGADALILHEQPNKGATIIEKLERESDVGFAVILMTADDVGAAKSSPSESRDRARQNVVLELGYFIGKVGRAKVCALHKGMLELPSDFLGVAFVEMDERGAWKMELARELIAAGIRVDPAGLI